MIANLETSKRRADGLSPATEDKNRVYATKEHVRLSFNEADYQAGAPQMAKNAAMQFQRAFNGIYDQPRHEPYREKVAEMVKEVARVNIEGTARAEVIFHGLNNSGVAKAISAASNGGKNPALSEMVIFHKKLSESFESLNKYVKALRSNPANSNRVVKPLSRMLGADQIESNRKRLLSAGFV